MNFYFLNFILNLGFIKTGKMVSTFQRKIKIVTSVGFLFCLFLLLCNDFYLKQNVGNFLTGKISDFTGLFIFPIFISIFFSRFKCIIYIVTGIFFILWKSPLSHGFIDLWNNLFFFNINRVVDYSDLLALSVLPLSYVFSNMHYKTVRIYPVVPIVISAFAFMATSYQKDYDYNKTYSFSFSKTELLAKINLIKYDSMNLNYPLSENIKNSNDYIVERGPDTIWYYVSGQKISSDTIYKFDKKKNAYTTEIDTIIQYKTIQRDSMYLNKKGEFLYLIPVRKYMMESSSGYCDWVYAKIKIAGNNETSDVSLIRIKTSNCMGMFEKAALKNEEKNLQTAFEKEFIEKINVIR